MARFDPRDLASWCGGAWAPAPPDVVTGVSNDSRTLNAGDLYVAIRGDRYDGHDFVGQAFDRGAAAAMVHLPFASVFPDQHPLLCVDDTKDGLFRLARGYRDGMQAEMVGITGSVGKTSVKEMTADVLSILGHTARTRGNWNNDIGLPLSLLQMEASDQYGVFEIGMNHPGELRPLCGLLRHRWAVLTPIGPVHMEFFDSLEGIAREKATLLETLPEDGVAVLNRDDPWYDLFASGTRARIVTVSMRHEADYRARALNGQYTRMEVQDRGTGDTAEYDLPMPGEYVMQNALLAIAVGREHGISHAALRESIRHFRPLAMRWNEVRIGDVLMVNDAYNANPVSMRAAIRAFGHLDVPGKRWLVLAGMFELGAGEDREHTELGEWIAAEQTADRVIGVGALGARIAEGARRGGWDDQRAVAVVDVDEAAERLAAEAGGGDAVLIKASRGERLERVVDLFERRTGKRSAVGG